MNFYNYFIYPYRYHTCKSNAVLLTFSRNVNNTALENVDVMTYILHPFAMKNAKNECTYIYLKSSYALKTFFNRFRPKVRT